MASACNFDAGKKESEASTGPWASTTEVDIHSSLEGMAELPRHLRWTTTISLPAEQIKDVRFLVDRQTLWIDAEPPYSYGEEGAYLATSYFYNPYSDKEGQSGHQFTRSRERDGGSLA